METSVLFRPVLKLLAAWRAEACHLLERYDDRGRAQAIEAMCGDLESVLAELPDLTLTYEEASAASGWAVGTIKNKVAAGELENVGTAGAGKVRLRDLKLDGAAVLLSLAEADAA